MQCNDEDRFRHDMAHIQHLMIEHVLLWKNVQNISRTFVYT